MISQDALHLRFGDKCLNQARESNPSTSAQKVSKNIHQPSSRPLNIFVMCEVYNLATKQICPVSMFRTWNSDFDYRICLFVLGVHNQNHPSENDQPTD